MNDYIFAACQGSRCLYTTLRRKKTMESLSTQRLPLDNLKQSQTIRDDNLIFKLTVESALSTSCTCMAAPH